MTTKTDNHNLRAKLDLRRKMLSGQSGLLVMDCFSGQDEAIWKQLRLELQVSEYLALDLKRKRNRLAIDSLRVLEGQKWHHDVIDLDAYGSPWEHWFQVLASDRHRSLTVFLTIGSAVMGSLPKIALQALGVPPDTPTGMHKQLTEDAVNACLSATYEYNWKVAEAFEAENPGGNARYIGVKLQK